eukprot:1257335-Rhodomonas_salina.3
MVVYFLMLNMILAVVMKTYEEVQRTLKLQNKTEVPDLDGPGLGFRVSVMKTYVEVQHTLKLQNKTEVSHLTLGFRLEGPGLRGSLRV